MPHKSKKNEHRNIFLRKKNDYYLKTTEIYFSYFKGNKV